MTTWKPTIASGLRAGMRSPLRVVAGRSGAADATELAALLAQLRAGNGHAGTGNITGSITANRISGVAPLGVIFDATATSTILTAIPFHELIHIWHYGDDDTATWSYGTMPGVSKKNLGEGAIGAHVFETPGTKTVRYTPAYVSSGGVLSVGATQTLTITVTDPDVVFANSNTICLANGSVPVAGVNGVPAGATCASATTWASVVDYCTAGKRVLLKAGDVWTHGTFKEFSGGVTGHLGRFGVGVNPKISITAASVAVINPTTSTTEDWRFVDIESEATGLAVGAARSGTRFLQCRNESDGGSVGGRFSTLLRINLHDAASIAHVAHDTVIADCHADTLSGGGGNIGLWCAQTLRLGVLGCSFNDASGVEFNMRLQGIKNCVISDCLIKDPMANGTKHALALRGWANPDSSWTGDYTENCVVRRNRITGMSASGLVQIAPQDNLKDERHRNILIDSNYIGNESTAGTGTCILGAGGTEQTIRNNILLNSVDSTLTTAITYTNGSSISINSYAILPPTNIYVYNNVLYCGKITASGTPARMVSLNSAETAGWQIKNNIMYLPNHTNASNSVAFGAGLAGCIVSNNSSNAQTRTSPNFVTTPPVVYTDWRCTSGYSVDSGAWVPVFTDFFGVARTGTADMGAINP